MENMITEEVRLRTLEKARDKMLKKQLEANEKIEMEKELERLSENERRRV